MKRLACLLCLLSGWIAPLPAPATPAKPNVVMVFIDDLGWGDFSCFGNRESATPVIDRLATEGIRFSQFYVNAPICSPSRCAVSTGQYPQRWKLTSFLETRANNTRRGMAQWLDPKAPTLARLLHDAGYATGHFGKWHLGGQRDVADAPPITTYGFDQSLTNFEGMGPKFLPLTQEPGKTEPGRIWGDAERLGGPFTWMQRAEITSGFVNAAKEFIDRAVRDDKPFYLNLWPDDVHSPFWPPVTDWPQGKRARYLAVLRNMDRQLAPLFDHIRSSPALRDRTLVLLCSDNGPEAGAGSAGPLRGTKGTLYEGGIRSPLIAWGRGIIDPAATGTHNASAVFSAIDLVPTLLALTGTAPPENTTFDGENILPAIRNGAPTGRRAPICWRRPPDRPNGASAGGSERGPLPDLAIREDNWKLLCDYDGRNARLHDLAKDPGETTDVAATHPEQTATLTRKLLAWHQQMPPDNGPNLTSARPPAPKATRGK